MSDPIISWLLSIQRCLDQSLLQPIHHQGSSDEFTMTFRLTVSCCSTSSVTPATRFHFDIKELFFCHKRQIILTMIYKTNKCVKHPTSWHLEYIRIEAQITSFGLKKPTWRSCCLLSDGKFNFMQSEQPGAARWVKWDQSRFNCFVITQGSKEIQFSIWPEEQKAEYYYLT